MTYTAVISTSSTDKPKITPQNTEVVQVTFDIYDVSVDMLLQMVGSELEIEIKEK